MARGLTAGQITRLQNASDIVEDLLELTFTEGSHSFYYTTGQYASTITTPTSGGAVSFTPQSFISSISSITESYEIGSNPCTITFERLKTGSGADLLPTVLNTVNYVRSRVVLYKLFRDANNMTPDTTNGLINYFDGSISGVSIEYTPTTFIYTISCIGAFSDFRQKGRTTADIAGALNNTKLYWGRFTL